MKTKKSLGLIRLVGLVVMVLASMVQLMGACAFPYSEMEDGASLINPLFVEAAESDFNWRGNVPAGRVVEIKGLTGDIRAEASSGAEVEVTAKKQSRTSDPNSVRIQVVEHPEGVTICAVYPSSDPNKQNRCGPGESRNSNVRDNDVRVDFIVRLPAGVRFDGSTVTGDIRAESLTADVEAKSVTGDIKISTTGLARAKTVTGSINASLGKADWTGELEFKTVTGDVNVTLPSNVSAELSAETVNGEIATDFPITVEGRHRGRQKLNGTVGGGGRALRVKTVTGSIRIGRAG